MRKKVLMTDKSAIYYSCYLLVIKILTESVSGKVPGQTRAKFSVAIGHLNDHQLIDCNFSNLRLEGPT